MNDDALVTKYPTNDDTLLRINPDAERAWMLIDELRDEIGTEFMRHLRQDCTAQELEAWLHRLDDADVGLMGNDIAARVFARHSDIAGTDAELYRAVAGFLIANDLIDTITRWRAAPNFEELIARSSKDRWIELSFVPRGHVDRNKQKEANRAARRADAGGGHAPRASRGAAAKRTKQRPTGSKATGARRSDGPIAG